MAKRRSSIRGRGAEILFGEPSAVEIEPRAPDLPASEAELPEPEPSEPILTAAMLAEEANSSVSALPEEPSSLGAELEQALFEEAIDGEPGPGREEDLSILEVQPPPTPEMESAFIEEAFGAQEPPEPVTEEPIPTLEVTMEEQDLTEEAAIYEPPPPETSDVASGVLPPRTSRVFFTMEDMEALAPYDIQAPDEGVEELELPERELTPEENQALLRRWGTVRLKELDEEISTVYDQVLSKVGENESIATECYNNLLKARDIVLRRDAAKISQAEYYVGLVRARLKRATDSEAGAKKYAWWITLWGFIWGLVFLAVLVSISLIEINDSLGTILSIQINADLQTFFTCMVWGGIGGVVAVWYSLFKHVGRRDFDTQFNLSYVGKPFLGLVLGATVYMLFHLLLTLGILPAGLQGGDGAQLAGVTPWIMYPVAWACGFKENRIFDLVDRVMKRIFSGSEEEESMMPSEGAEGSPKPAA
jgi:hypothetical protein